MKYITNKRINVVERVLSLSVELPRRYRTTDRMPKLSYLVYQENKHGEDL